MKLISGGNCRAALAGVGLSILLGVAPQLSYAADLVLQVKEVSSDEGSILIEVYANQKDFEAGVSVRQSAQPAKAGEMTFTFADLPAGEYGVMLFHDLNGNVQIDTNMLGVPKEPWGASLEGTSVFGKPGWADIVFSLTESGKSLNIELD